MLRVLALADKLRRHELGRNASWILTGQGASFLLQAGYFVLLARVLGVYEYGVFVGVFALVNTLMPYSGMGSGMLFMRYVSSEPSSAPIYWGYSLFVISTVSVLLAGILGCVGPTLTGSHDRTLIVVLVFANCLFAQIVLCASRVFQTYEKLRVTATLTFLSNLLRFAALVVMQICFHHATARQWAIAVLIASATSALIAAAWVRAVIGSVTFTPGLIRSRALEGLGFAFAGSTQFAYNDIDKTMLSHYGMIAQAGFYTLAYRIVDFATTPIGSMDVALLPRYFKLSQSGREDVARLAAKSVKVALLVGVGIAGTLVVVGPLIPRMVGRDFSQALIVLQWICWLPLLRGIHQITGSALTGLGLQPYRTATQFGVALLNLILNWWLIPVHGWRGAAWASLASDGLLGIANASLLVWVSLIRSSVPSTPLSGSEPA